MDIIEQYQITIICNSNKEMVAVWDKCKEFGKKVTELDEQQTGNGDEYMVFAVCDSDKSMKKLSKELSKL